MTVCFLGLFVNGRYHTACMYSGPMVWNSASVTFLKICYYGGQWDLIWCNNTLNVLTEGEITLSNTFSVESRVIAPQSIALSTTISCINTHFNHWTKRRIQVIWHMYQHYLQYTRHILSKCSLFTDIQRSSQCSTTGVTKAVVCTIPSVGWCI